MSKPFKDVIRDRGVKGEEGSWEKSGKNRESIKCPGRKGIWRHWVTGTVLGLL